MQTRSSYIQAETLISVVINTALSIGFVFLAFHGQSRVPVAGKHGIVIDMAPQTFMVVLMSFLVPALLTSKRMSAGALTWRDRTSQTTRFNPFVWAICAAAAAMGLVVALSWVLLPMLFTTGVAFTPLLVAKACFGATLAAFVTPWAIKTALR